MLVVDVDSHFEPPADWLDAHPDLARDLPPLLPESHPSYAPGSAETMGYQLAADIFTLVPPAERMPVRRLMTPAMDYIFSGEVQRASASGANSQWPQIDAATRVQVLDEQGIDLQFANSAAFYSSMRYLEDVELGKRFLSAGNRWLADALSGRTDRLTPVTSLRLEDLDWCVDELTAMRGLGSRAFHVLANAPGGIPPFAPEYDRLWSAATDLGMVAVLHVGNQPALFHPGYARTDDPMLLRQLAVSQPYQATQVFLNALVFGGVLERHPNLTLVLMEQGIDWLPLTIEHMDQRAWSQAAPLLGDYPFPLKPSEYLARSLRVTPLPVPHQNPTALLESHTEMVVFSSDMPHFEGSLTPVQFYEKVLVDVSAEARESFFGGSMAECFARMGDPLR